MDIVLFKYALEHILRINRIITNPKGHAVLIGLTGSGKTSFATLASYISSYESLKPGSADFSSYKRLKAILKKLFTSVGIDGKKTTWIIN